MVMARAWEGRGNSESESKGTARVTTAGVVVEVVGMEVEAAHGSAVSSQGRCRQTVLSALLWDSWRQCHSVTVVLQLGRQGNGSMQQHMVDRSSSVLVTVEHGVDSNGVNDKRSVDVSRKGAVVGKRSGGKKEAKVVLGR